MAGHEEGEATRLIRAGFSAGRTSRTVGPPIERGSTVLMANAAALYDDDLITYGRAGLGVLALGRQDIAATIGVLGRHAIGRIGLQISDQPGDHIGISGAEMNVGEMGNARGTRRSHDSVSATGAITRRARGRMR